MPDISIPDEIEITKDISKVIYDKELIVLSTATHGIREVLESSKSEFNKEQVIVNVAKGIENNTLLRISEIVGEILPNNPYAILSGPSHAEEVARNIPTTVVSASKDKTVAEYVQDVFMSPYFRVYTNPDIIGVELGGSLKKM